MVAGQGRPCRDIRASLVRTTSLPTPPTPTCPLRWMQRPGLCHRIFIAAAPLPGIPTSGSARWSMKGFVGWENNRSCSFFRPAVRLLVEHLHDAIPVSEAIEILEVQSNHHRVYWQALFAGKCTSACLHLACKYHMVFFGRGVSCLQRANQPS
ncbi:hypothetical protein CGRA01v4_10859 [Colletotrichum graminicola]|nr:hypothetical protein CGRA01v4_10859 [Colletotrichum graminicola]